MTTHPSAGVDVTAVRPHIKPVAGGARVEAALSEAERLIEEMDPADIETNMVRVFVCCARAICIALENRT
jgi:hypothetical protein